MQHRKQETKTIEDQIHFLVQKTSSNGKLSKKAARLLVDVVQSQLEVSRKSRNVKIRKEFIRDALLFLSLVKEIVVVVLHR